MTKSKGMLTVVHREIKRPISDEVINIRLYLLCDPITTIVKGEVRIRITKDRIYDWSGLGFEHKKQLILSALKDGWSIQTESEFLNKFNKHT